MKLRVLVLGAFLVWLGLGAEACDCGEPADHLPPEDMPTDGFPEGDGGSTLPDGGSVLPDGGTLLPDGGSILPDGGTNGGSGTPDGGGSQSDGGSTACVPVSCGGKTYACGNCQDDDHDGKIDSEDPDCLGPCHNREDSFDLGIPGGGHGNCGSIECYYDSDTGGGNDNCVYDLRCDPKEPDPTCRYPPPASVSCSGSAPDGGQSDTCHHICGPLTPNGCDCFGCCTVTLQDGGARDIFLGSEAANDAARISAPPCTLANAGDPVACRACTINPTCAKSCGTCQLCLGKTTLPPECFPPPPATDGGTSTADGGTVPQADGGGNTLRCPGGEQPCGLPGDPACPVGNYCITGCCEIILL